MKIDIMMKINNDINQKRYLREHSYWYKYLNRSSSYYEDFIKNMKKDYKLTTIDKINKVTDSINMLKMVVDVLK